MTTELNSRSTLWFDVGEPVSKDFWNCYKPFNTLKAKKGMALRVSDQNDPRLLMALTAPTFSYSQSTILLLEAIS
jgi:hypothetical protein